LRRLHALGGRHGAINVVTFQPGGTRLASDGADRTIRIWNVTIGAQILTLRGHRRAIERLAFSPDGTTLASTTLDGTVELWASEPAMTMGPAIWHREPAVSQTQH
jgi:WD40 repeat protein